MPLDQLPAEANTVRLVADDPDTDPGQWLAVTPPRVPTMQTLQTVVGSSDPVLLDWAVGLAFPCQRPFDHRYGVAEVPQWRVLPDRIGAESTNAWQDKFGGGPLGWTDQLLSASTLATYLSNDWDRDWGSLEAVHIARRVGDARAGRIRTGDQVGYLVARTGALLLDVSLPSGRRQYAYSGS